MLFSAAELAPTGRHPRLYGGDPGDGSETCGSRTHWDDAPAEATQMLTRKALPATLTSQPKREKTNERSARHRNHRILHRQL